MRLRTYNNTNSASAAPRSRNDRAAERIHNYLAARHAEAVFYRGILLAAVVLLLMGASLRWLTHPQPPRASTPGPGQVVSHLQSRPAGPTGPTSPTGPTGPISSDPASSNPAGLSDDTQAPAFAAFNQWIADYLTADSADVRAALLPRGTALAAERREALKALIETNPKKSLEAAIPLVARQRLPPSITDQLEERIEGNGDLEVIGTFQSADSNTAAIKRSLTLNGQTYQAFVYGRRLSQMSASSLPVHGIAVGDALALHEDPVRPMETGEAPNPALPVANPDNRCPVSGAPINPIIAVQAGGQVYHLCCGEHVQTLNQALSAQENAWLLPVNRRMKTQTFSSWTTGVKTVLFMRVRYADRPDPSISEADAAELMKPVNSFFETTSFGLVSMQTTTTPLLVLPGTVAAYQSNDRALLADTRQASAAAGFNPNDFDLDLVFCGPAFVLNQAFIGNKGAWVSTRSAGIVCHELGHNLGLFHANAWVTSDGTTIGEGKNAEYGNWFDVMGYGTTGPSSFNAFEKHILGWLPDSNVTSVASNGVYRLFAMDSSALESGNSYALKIPKDNQRDYWIELRQAQSSPELENSIVLLWSPWSESNGGSELLNCNPASNSHPALQVGQSFYDLEKGLKISPLRVNHIPPASADVQVEQVYFLSLDLSWPPTDGTASAAREPRLRSQPLAPDLNSAHVPVTIPEDGSYIIWVQAVSSVPGSNPVSISVADDAGDVGTATSSPASGLAAWSRVTVPDDSSPGGASPQIFSFSKGEHTLQVAVGSGRPEGIHLLLTTDSAAILPPVLSAVEDQVILAGSSVSVPFFVTAIGQSAADLDIQISSENPSVIGETNWVLNPSGPEWILTINSSETQTGAARLHLTVTDHLGRYLDQSFVVTVLGRVQTLVNSALPGSHLVIPAGTSFENVVIDKDLSLEGAGIDQTIIDSHGGGPGFLIKPNRNVQLSGVTVRNGVSSGLINYGSLRLVSSSVVGCHAAGIQNRGTLVLEQVVLQDNHAPQGGGLDNVGTATLHDCSITSNVATGGGGAVINRKGATLVCDSCSVAGNQAVPGNGGGFWNLGDLTLRNCTIFGNSALDQGGAESGRNRWTGGGVVNSGQLTMENCTVCRNQAQADGGGLSSTGQIKLVNTIIADNSSLTSAAVDCVGTITSAVHNLIQNATGFTLPNGAIDNIIGQDAKLGLFANNGGLTMTVALLPGSPAIDAGDCSLAPGADQRGMSRPLGLACDIGAFEFQPAPALTVQAGLADGRLLLQPNERYVLETSSDLSHWATLGEYRTDADGLLEFADPIPNSPNRFYRVRPAAAASPKVAAQVRF